MKDSKDSCSEITADLFLPHITIYLSFPSRSSPLKVRIPILFDRALVQSHIILNFRRMEEQLSKGMLVRKDISSYYILMCVHLWI